VTASILTLAHHVADLPPGKRLIFDRIFSVDAATGRLKLPGHMIPWAKTQFGPLGPVTTQTVVRITNTVSGECSVYNPLRVLKPHARFPRAEALDQEEEDQFAAPLDNTSEDLFGRVVGKHCVTASNIAKYEQYHCVVVFKNHDPLNFSCDEVADYIDTGWKWAQRAHEFDPLASYGLFLWNCNNRAGASIRHGHAQVVLGRGSHYPKVEQVRRAAEQYRERWGDSYFDDLFAAHESLGLGWRTGDVKTLVYLTALKQNEVMVLAPALSRAFAEEIYRVLAAFRGRMNVTSFNVGIVLPPFGEARGWEEFPVIARIVDRGNRSDVSSDIGAMEFYGANVVHSDPFETAGALGLD
jgi:hypothetical protein